MEIRAISAAIKINGNAYGINWTGHALTIEGVTSWKEVQQLLGIAPEAAPPSTAEATVQLKEIFTEAPALLRGGPGSAAAPPLTIGIKPKLTLGGAAPVVPPTLSTMTSADIKREMDEEPPAAQAPVKAKGTVISTDVSAYARMTLLGEIVDAIRDSGAKTYADVWKFVEHLRDANISPAIDKIHKDGKLEERVRRQCTNKGIEGAL
jgi:hypothetical protein